MRRRLLSLALVGFSAILAACAAGLQAEDGRTPWLSVASTIPEGVRVRVLHTKSRVLLSSTAGTYSILSGKDGKSLSLEGSQEVRAVRGGVQVGRKTLRGSVLVTAEESSGILRVNGRRYRGKLVIHPVGRGTLDVIEILPLDEYLYGVLPKEVDPAWALESLKAQAVVSRSYVLANKESALGAYDVSNSVIHQVYGGLESERTMTNRAVDETTGQILTDRQGKPLQAFFSASCGGCTDFPEAVWSSALSNDGFGVVKETFCRDYPRQKWSLDVSLATILKRVRHAGVHLRDLRQVGIAKKSESGRAQTIGLKTSRGLVLMNGNKFRLALGPETLRSTLLTQLTSGSRTVHIEGLGWGHGVGLCQWGARGRAMSGQTYDEILKAYYPGATLKRPDTPSR